MTHLSPRIPVGVFDSQAGDYETVAASQTAQVLRQAGSLQIPLFRPATKQTAFGSLIPPLSHRARMAGHDVGDLS